ncbi:MAG: hypothetical protein CL946_06065 [Ectothiorhodospiraceae bacterium]|nr:hypothetical protein [Ectothiorhodospiraceae bacterium]
MASTYQYVECVGTSTKSIEDAITTAVETVKKNNKISWFEVTAMRGRLVESDLEYQATVKFGCIAE